MSNIKVGNYFRLKDRWLGEYIFKLIKKKKLYGKGPLLILLAEPINEHNSYRVIKCGSCIHRNGRFCRFPKNLKRDHYTCFIVHPQRIVKIPKLKAILLYEV